MEDCLFGTMHKASAFDKELCWTVGASTDTNSMFDGTTVESFGDNCEEE
jgi:hypothetical protein